MKKIVILVGDGMSDYPVPELKGLTPLEAADTPNMDFLVKNGICGMTLNVPPGMSPGSDTANLSIFGYDPGIYYSGRAPLEAINMGIELGPDDAAFRCNIVKIKNSLMDDFTAGHIDSGLGRAVIEEINKSIKLEGIRFFPGVSYRNIMLWKNYPCRNMPQTTPPHDITGRPAASYMPEGDGSGILRSIMEKSSDIIASSPEIKAAKSRYKGEPQSLWLWGGGRKPAMESLYDRFGIKGRTISAVDLIHGIGKAAGLEPIEVEGATGYIDTDYTAKARALLENIEHCDFILLHVESPDESGHEGNLEHKLRSIEDFDKKVVGPVIEGMKKFGDYALMVLPDHPTPLSIRTHTGDPVPFVIYSSRDFKSPAGRGRNAFSEKQAASSGLYIEKGHSLLESLIKGGF